MSYRHIKYEDMRDPSVRMIFHRADLYIADAFSMFYLPLDGSQQGGGCNYTVVLTLLCVVDGIARGIYPTVEKVDDHEKRFKKLLRDKLLWGPSEKGWMDQSGAARQLYLEFRNPLVHELGKDNPSSARPENFLEPIIGKWGAIPPEIQDIDYVDALSDWDLSWPTMSVQKTKDGSRIKLCAAALYWAVKNMVQKLATGIS